MSVINMMPRDHHYTFTHRLLPRELFKDPDKIVAELTGPMGGTFLFFLWEELGKAVTPTLKHVEPGTLPGSDRMQVLKLDVVGFATEGDKTLIVISLPPTEFPGEAMFVAVVLERGQARYFAYERNSGIASLGDEQDAAYLGEYKADNSRTSHGSKPGTDAGAFVRALCGVLGMNFDETLAKIGAAPPEPLAFGKSGGGNAPTGTGRLNGVGNFLSVVVLLMLLWRPFIWITGGLIYDLLGFPIVTGLQSGLGMVMGITLIVWSYQIFSGLDGKGGWSPIMAALGWLIPVANFFLPPFILRSGWRAVSNNQGGLVPFLWWPFHLATTALTIFWAFVPMLSPQLDSTGLSPDAINTIFEIMGTLTLGISVVSYALLLYIVRTITTRA